MPGTERTYGLCACHATSSTERAYGVSWYARAMLCPVLSEPMRPPGLVSPRVGPRPEVGGEVGQAGGGTVLPNC
eukprot:446163-Rhodomonas_salina.5